jgi:mRNA interferase MazF
MFRGEVWWINFDPSVGGEIRKERPAVIISINPFNKFSNRVQVIPLSSNIKKLYPSETLVTIKGQQSKALVDQIATVSKKRLRKKIATLTNAELIQIGEIIKQHFGLLQ